MLILVSSMIAIIGVGGILKLIGLPVLGLGIFLFLLAFVSISCYKLVHKNEKIDNLKQVMKEADVLKYSEEEIRELVEIILSKNIDYGISERKVKNLEEMLTEYFFSVHS